jgi:8-oxo-dGTP pyrophosphatase MutT (NUDIX family)
MTLETMPDEEAVGRLDLPESGPPPLAYWIAAIRETFEETGILLGRSTKSPAAVSGDSRESDPENPSREIEPGGPEGGSRSRGQAALLSGQKSFADVLDMRGRTLDPGDLRYIGHWLTPESEPRRYDTRFFISRVGRGVEVRPHEKEMVDHVWLTPAEALIRNRQGSFPLVLPTLMTLEELLHFPTAARAVDTLGTRPVPRRLPVPETAPGGIRFRIPGPAAAVRV